MFSLQARTQPFGRLFSSAAAAEQKTEEEAPPQKPKASTGQMLGFLAVMGGFAYLMNYLALLSEKKRELPADRAPEFDLLVNPLDTGSRAVWMCALMKNLSFNELHAPLGFEAATVADFGKEASFAFKNSPLSPEEIMDNFQKKMCMSPEGELPIVIDGNSSIAGEVAVVEWLGDAFRLLQPSLFPKQKMDQKYLTLLAAINALEVSSTNLLNNQDPSQDPALAAKIHESFFSVLDMCDEDSAFLVGHHTTFADMKLISVYDAMNSALEHYRHFSLIPEDKSKHVWIDRAHKWLHAVEDQPQCKLTNQGHKAYVERYRRNTYPRGASGPMLVQK